MPKGKTNRLRTADDVRKDFDAKGIAIADWARENGFEDPTVVYQLLGGHKKGRRGESHRAAVLLGLKEGVVAEAPHG